MDFITARVGWAVGSGQIVSTRDGGETWKNQYAEYMADAFFAPHRVSILTQDSCWVIDTVGFGQIRCFHTKDGGRTWINVNLGPSTYPKDIFFINQSKGWIISDDGKFLGGGGTIHRTENAGESWHREKLIIKGKPEILRFLNARQGWLVESVITKDQAKTIGRVLRSNDGGKNWGLAATFESQILDLAVLDAQRIFVSGEGGLIARTADGGNSWQRLRTRTRANINSIAFDGNSKGIAGADFGTMLTSDDGGVSWSKIKGLPEDSNCVKVLIPSRDRGVIATDKSIYLFAPFPKVGSKTSAEISEWVSSDL
jgi:photosystem II stability/assembly factor-like uncharacterized protein